MSDSDKRRSAAVRTWAWAAAGLALLAGADPARAEPATRPAATQPAHLGQLYRDSVFGFEIRPFSSRSPFQQAANDGPELVGVEKSTDWDFVSDSTALVRFTWPERGWILKVEQVEAKAQTTPRDLAIDLVASLDERGQARFFEREVAGRKAVGWVYLGQTTGNQLFRQAAAVRVRPGQFFVVTFDSLPDARAQAEATFPAVLDSFAVLDSDVTREMIRAGLERGTRLTGQARAVARGDLLVPEAWYAIQMPVPSTSDAKLKTVQTVGFLRVQERRGEYPVVAPVVDEKGRVISKGEFVPGVIIEERGRVYQAGNVVVTLRRDYFMADKEDLTLSSVFESITRPICNDDGTTRMGPDGKPLYNQQFDRCSTLRKDQILLASFSEEQSDLPRKNLTLQTNASFLDPVLEKLVPRLINRAGKDLYAFSAFSQAREALNLYTLRVVGPQAVVLDGQSVPATLLEWREGLDAPATQMWVDDKGAILKQQAGEISMVRTPKAVLQARFEEARQADLPAPTPAAGRPAIVPGRPR